MEPIKDYWKAREQAHKVLGETNDCSVFAVAIGCAVDYDMAHYALEAQGRRKGHGAYTWQIMKAIQDLGYAVQDLTQPARKLGGKTLLTLQRVMAHPQMPLGRYVIITSSHAVGWDGTAILDWATETRKRVTQVWRITKPGATDNGG